MKLIESTPEYRAFKVNKDLDQQVEKMASTLIFLLKINYYSGELVLLIGKDGDRNNADVIKGWVRRNLCCASCMKEQSVQMLYSKLERELNALEDCVR